MSTEYLLSPASRRSLSLLRALAELNAVGHEPYASELVRANDSRERVPLSTMSARRARVWEMVRLGYIRKFLPDGASRYQLHITKLGTEVLQSWNDKA